MAGRLQESGDRFIGESGHRNSRDIGIGFGIKWPLGGPRVAQASPKGHAGAARASNGRSTFICNKRWKKAGGGQDRVIGTSGDRDIGRTKPAQFRGTQEISRKEDGMAKAKEHGANGYSDEEWEVYLKATTTEDYSAVDRMRNERRGREREEEMKEQWPASEAAGVFTQLAEAFTACQKMLEQQPGILQAAKLADSERHDVFTMLRDNLEKANRAPRCEYPRSGGRPCRAPKVRGQKYCNMHLAMEAARPTKFSLPALDDANSIQVALNKTAQGLVDGSLDEKVATKLAYVLQVAMSNVDKLDFEPEEVEEEMEEEVDQESDEEMEAESEEEGVEETEKERAD
jgi:hypothetical protein